MRTRAHPLWIFVSWLAVVCSFVWVIILLKSGFEKLIEHGISINYGFVLLALILMLTSSFLSAQVFFQLMQTSGARFTSFLEACELNFTAQVLRHIPGRFFGVAYQIIKAKHVAGTSEWVTGNIIIMIMSTWLAMLFSALTLVALSTNTRLWHIMFLVFVIMAPVVIYGLHLVMQRITVAHPWLSLIANHLKIPLNALFGPPRLVQAVAWGLCSWTLYAMAWAAIGQGIAGLNGRDGLLLGALYTLAWAGGYLSFVTPAGLGVRELIFVTIASSFPPDAVAFIAVAARVVFILSDVVLGIVFLVINNKLRPTKEPITKV